MLEAGQTWRGEVTVSVDGARIPLAVSLVPGLEDGRLAWVGASAYDLRPQREREVRLRHLATHDELTGLANRSGFIDAAEVPVARGGCTLVLLDLDHLKTVNDTLGHPAGDQLLVEVAQRIGGVLRDVDTAARLGGDVTSQPYGSVRDLPVCADDGTVVGTVAVERLLPAAPSETIEALLDPTPPTVAEAGTTAEVAAARATRDGQSTLIVVDDERRYLGVVPGDRLLAVLLEEHEEDVARAGGFAASSTDAPHATEESVGRRLGHRLPWLLLGLAGALATAGLMSGFEQRLRTHLLLALFVPGIVYLADAVGTQTEAIVIRGLALGVRIRDVAGRELLTGALAGAVLALIFVPFGLWLWGDRAVVTAVAISLWAACTAANGIAMALPALFDRFGVDPAFGSGPLATVVQDLLSIVIYLTVATLLVT